MPEEPLLENGEVRVTTARVVVGATTYAVANLTSVRTERIEPSRAPSALLSVVGAFCILGSFQLKFSEMSLFLMLGGLLVVAAISLSRKAKPTFRVILATTAGEVQAFSSDDWSQVSQIVEALNAAIAKR